MGKINDDFDEWARQNMSFPEDFLAEAMKDDGDEGLLDFKSRAKKIKTEITLDDFGSATGRAIALFKSISDFAGVKIDIDPFVKVAALIASELFDDEEEEED